MKVKKDLNRLMDVEANMRRVKKDKKKAGNLDSKEPRKLIFGNSMEEEESGKRKRPEDDVVESFRYLISG